MKDKWISVKDKLPEKRGYYLCYADDRNGNKIHKVYFLISNFDGFAVDKFCNKPSHWMPLPKPPKP